MSRRQFRIWSVVAVTCAVMVPVFGQGNDTGRAAGGRGGRGAGRGGRGGETLVPTALLSERNLNPGDFPTMRSTTGNIYVWEDVHALGFLTNNLIVITSDGVLVADGQNSPEATKKMVDAIGLLTSQPISTSSSVPSTAIIQGETKPSPRRPRSSRAPSRRLTSPGRPMHRPPTGERRLCPRHGGRSARAEDG